MLITSSQAAQTDSFFDAGTLFGLAVAMTVAYTLGRARTRWLRARSDYEAARQRLPLLRNDKWRRWGAMIVSGAVVAVFLAVVFQSDTSTG